MLNRKRGKASFQAWSVGRGRFFGNKRGEVLPETILFIILNLAFITILILFVVKQSGEGHLIEQSYAKQIALLIDAAEPNMEIFLDMGDAAEIDGVWWRDNYGEAIMVEGNIVTAKFSEKGGYSYSFFNNVVPVLEMGDNGEFYMVIRNG